MYIVCGFFVSNSEKPRRFKEDKDKNKQDVILYCGPSNKSVDVVAGKLFASFIFLSEEKYFLFLSVAIITLGVPTLWDTEYLLKVGSSLRTLRAYSQHVEMLDYPYPESTHQFSRKAFRQERAKEKLRYGSHI